ncbi:unnamed protein product [Blepharisma stoltei]|uniref:EF-hand domain-containing protein n=1 Tax=Blepharisma stoltei TaxID=1481888 RepID=A0AAU9JBB0_9CILI|nr:unnamed protein product [Blepharisma stoltei]
MGCADSREKTSSPEEERIIAVAEDRLGFKFLNAQWIDRTIHRYSISNKLSEAQFSAAFNELSIDLANFEEDMTPFKKFYSGFLNDDSLTYSAQQLSSLGILLGKGSAKDKASLLFQNYDVDLSKSIDYDEFVIMLNELIEIGLTRIPKLAWELAAEDEKFLLGKYMRRLEIAKPIVKKFYVVMIHRDKEAELSYDDFVNMFSKEELKMMVNAKTLRQIAIHHYNTVIAPANLVKCYVLAEMKESKTLLDSTKGVEEL